MTITGVERMRQREKRYDCAMGEYRCLQARRDALEKRLLAKREEVNCIVRLIPRAIRECKNRVVARVMERPIEIAL